MSEHDMELLLQLVERNLGAAWRDVVAYLREQNSLDDIAASLEAGDHMGAIEGVEHAAQSFAAAEDAAYRDAATQTAEALDAVVPDKLIRFDQTNVGAVRWAEHNQLERVSGLTAEQRQTIQQVLIDGARASRNPREVARDLRASLGLSPQQERWVASYRELLESQDYTSALDRELSHGWSDQAIAAAARRDVAMTPEAIDTAVERYRANVVSMRAEVIARTEGLRVVHQGADEAIRQAVARGDVRADALTREWATAHDGRVRSSHRAMQGQQRAIGESFETGEGTLLRYPGDPAAPASETAQCRCVVSTRYASGAAQSRP